MGVRLDGPVLEHSKGYNIVSDGIATGAIQVPGSGQPIILLADRQTTGGYPKIATVISSDLGRVGQMLPGASLRFEAVTPMEANRITRERHSALQTAISSIRPVGKAGPDLDRLSHANLISGVWGK